MNARMFVIDMTNTTDMRTARNLPSNVFLRSSIFSNIPITQTFASYGRIGCSSRTASQSRSKHVDALRLSMSSYVVEYAENSSILW